MSSREEMLKTIRENKPSEVTPRPSLDIAHANYEDINAKFTTALASVGGLAVFVDGMAEAEAYIKEHYISEKVIVSNIEALRGLTTKDANATDDPHTLRDVDLAIVKAEFAVAENGAVWVQDPNNRHRVLYFITQKLVIIVPKKDLLRTMHEAYERISFEKGGFGLFISGPSKTADIEQALVIGAHGAVEACVILI